MNALFVPTSRLRGSVIIFTSIASVVFLKRKLYMHHWIGIALVVIGTSIVGSEFAVCPPHKGYQCKGVAANNASQNAIVGNIIVILAQIIVATQMVRFQYSARGTPLCYLLLKLYRQVVEEKFIGGWNLPALLVVGCEGVL